MEQKIIDKYNIPAPRYTSYPPANYFGEMGAADYLPIVDASAQGYGDQVSFYLHSPFCKRLCHYCGCNSIQWRDTKVVARYVDCLHKEIDTLAPHLGNNRHISQIHYGGGSPSQLSIPQLRSLNEHLLSLMPTIDRPEIAIECHPGFLKEQDWIDLCESGFTRFSIGVQDLNVDVLHAVNRKASVLPLEEIFRIVRSYGLIINLDFLFGLPLQSAEEFSESIRQAVALRPDRVVTFSYGHVPWVFKRQLVLEELGLPATDEKERMGQEAARLLTEAGYRRIGMDHFVLPDDELSLALESHQLHRNFQGYCTRRTTGQVYAFGATGISQLSTAYAQNIKDVEQYMATVEADQLPIVKGYVLTPEQMVMREIVEQLMCNYHLSWSELAARLDMATEAVKACCHYDEAGLREMASDGILQLTPDTISMPTGSPFVRNVVALLDPLMQGTDKKFSKPI